MIGVKSSDSNGDSRQRRRTKQSSSWSAWFLRFGFLARVYRALETLSHLPLLTALPLFTYMFLGSVYFLGLVQALTDIDSYVVYWDSGLIENADKKLAAELLKQKFQIVSYLLILFLLLFRMRQFVSFFKRERTLILTAFVLLLSTFGSDYPDRVIINVVHLSLGIIATWLYFNDERRQRNIVYSACLITLGPLFITLGGSFILFFALENSSLADIVAGQRFSGIAGNPNTLGGVCIAAAWATFGLMSLTPFKSMRMLLLAGVAGIVIFNAWSTSSTTTLTIILSMVLMMIGSGLFRMLGKKGRAIVVVGCTALVFGVLFVLVVQQSADEYAFAATDAVGKDLSLTGRTDLWQVGWDAFLQRPILGWGYDNHQTVLETPAYGIPFNIYHNGYLDSLIAGGILFGAAILYSYGAFFTRYLSFKNTVSNGFPLMVAVAAVSIQNMTEYSLFRSNTAVFHIYVISFMAVSMGAIKPQKRSRSAGGRERQRGSSARRLRW